MIDVQNPSNIKLMYYPIFLWRRVLFVIIPTFLYWYPGF
jgi:hypothetical protein